MTNEQKALNLLGMATRAGKLVSGEEQVIAAIQKGKVDVVICVTDASSKTATKLEDKCRYYDVDYIQWFTTETLSNAIGKQRSIVAIADKGFTKSIKKLFDLESENMHMK